MENNNGMKTWKHRTVAVILTIFALTFVFPACDSGRKKTVSREKTQIPEQPQQREATIELYSKEYNERYKITVQGNLTQTQWDGIARRIESLIRQVYENEYFGIKEKAYFIVAFQKNDAVIIVEDTSAYSIYKTTGDRILYLNVNALHNSSVNMVMKIRAAVMAMAVSKTAIE
jgi:hypothetical protein